MDVMKKVPVREQEPAVRAKNFEEVCLGYNAEEAVEEASRCLNCKNAQCVKGCPVSIDIPGFIKEVRTETLRRRRQSSENPAPARRLRPCVPPGEPVRGQVHPWHQGRARVHRKAGAVCGGLVPGKWD